MANHHSEEGLIIETAGAKDEVVKFIPALTISEEVLVEGLDLLEKPYTLH